MAPGLEMEFGKGHSKNVMLAITGVSEGEVCGVRDYAKILASQMGSRGYEARVFWPDTSNSSTGGLFGKFLNSTAQCRSGDTVAKACEAEVILYNYSVFAGSWHGVPTSVPLLAWRLWKAPSAVVLIGHEMVYPWWRRGWRGFIHAVAQRTVLLPLVAASTVVVVTTEERRNWVRTRRWLPSRPVVWAPVFSNVPVRSKASSTLRSAFRTVGVFGYGHESQNREMVVRAVSRAASRLEGVQLVLIGGPGPCSTQGLAWRELAEATGCPYRFTGTLSPDELSRELSELAVFICFDDAGPTSRKTTLAAALAHAIPTIALDGPGRWAEMVDSGAVELSPPDAEALERALLRILTNSTRRERLGLAGRRFYDRRMAAEVVARQFVDVVAAAMHEREPGNRGRHAGSGREAIGSAGPAV